MRWASPSGVQGRRVGCWLVEAGVAIMAILLGNSECRTPNAVFRRRTGGQLPEGHIVTICTHIVGLKGGYGRRTLGKEDVRGYGNGKKGRCCSYPKQGRR